MKKKIVSVTMLTLLLVGMLTLAFYIKLVKASGTIYIREDGSIEPSTANITSADNVVYHFTDNNYDSIVVERDNIVVDGAGYTVQGTPGIFPDYSKGIYLSERSNVTIKNLEIKGFWYGIFVYHSFNNSISGNNIVNSSGGIILQEGINNTIYENNIANNDRSIFLTHSSRNKFYHNNFINNTSQVYFSHGLSSTVWDDGYPSGGNFWSDYTGVDSNNDGIGDSAYYIQGQRDRYPLMAQYVIPDFPPSDTTSPNISILSPENKTYALKDVNLTFTVSEKISWIGYSLDGQANVTITGNITLSELSDGSHSLTVYAKDTARNPGAPETIYFSIETPSPALPIWVVTTIVIIAVAGAAFLVYFAKIRRRARERKISDYF